MAALLLAAICWPLTLLPALIRASELTGLSACSPDTLVIYRLDIDTMWSKSRFPKQYPLWRPPAQFSKFFGMSHNSSRMLFRPGELASEAVRKFAELGSAAGLEVTGQGDAGVLDQFTTPPVTSGQGTTHARLFVDGTHSMVSLLSRLVPSPDWFIGIDSVDLCDSGRWIDSLDVKLFPMDAGTDQGLTFTSPNWATEPHQPVCQITSRRPSHPAGSFHYPHLATLPELARLRLARVSSYQLSDELHRPDAVTYTVETLEPAAGTGAAAGLTTTRVSSSVGGHPGLRVYGITAGGSEHLTPLPLQPERAKNDTGAGVYVVATQAAAASGGEEGAKGNGFAVASASAMSRRRGKIQSTPAARPEFKTFSKKVQLSSSGRSSNALVPWPSGQHYKRRGPHKTTSSTTWRPANWTPGDDSAAAAEALRPDGAAARAALAPGGGVARVALRPDGTVARVTLRPNGPPLRLGGLRVWAVQSSGDSGGGSNSDGGNGGGSGSGDGAEVTKVAAGDKKAIIRKIADHYRRRKGRHRRRRLRHRRKRKRAPRDCSVGEWAAWGACSRTCGIGETARSRPVAVHPRRGGRPCPSLRQRRWCGSERTCRAQRRRYFQW